MGSCFSKKKMENGKKEKEKKAPAESRDPPAPESPQEEKVKEVLSETPKPRAKELFKKKEEEVEIKHTKTEESEDTSDLYSESISASTQKTAAAEEVEQKRRRVAARSPSKKRSFSGELQTGRRHRGEGVEVGCRSGGRSSPSPPARKAVPAADAARHRHAARCEKFARDHKGSDRTAKRRSVSPAAKRVVPDHRTPAAAAVPAGGQHCRSLSASRISGAPGKAAEEEGEEESLENPLVSLECFIFL